MLHFLKIHSKPPRNRRTLPTRSPTPTRNVAGIPNANIVRPRNIPELGTDATTTLDTGRGGEPDAANQARGMFGNQDLPVTDLSTPTPGAARDDRVYVHDLCHFGGERGEYRWSEYATVRTDHPSYGDMPRPISRRRQMKHMRTWFPQSRRGIHLRRPRRISGSVFSHPSGVFR